MRTLAAAPLAYILALVLSKGAGFLMLPLVTGSLSVAEYARLEVLASVADVASMICGLGLADAFFRFTARGEPAERDRHGAQLLGCAVLFAALLLMTGQLGLTVSAGYGFEVSPAMRFLAVSVALTAAIELPLGWLRGNGKAWSYALIFTGRTAVQCSVSAVLLLQGYGIDAVLAGAALADLVASTLLVGMQIRAIGFRWPGSALLQALRYGAPLAFGGIAGFALGSLDRWFLVSAVPAVDLAHYGLAVKFGALVIMVMQPFGLWWYPRRLATLELADGAARTARTVGGGLTLLWMGAACVAAAAPVAMRFLLPNEYLGARELVPWLALCFALHETASLVNVGSYRGTTGMRPMLVNWAGAAVALFGYAVAIPLIGTAGAILATAFAHSLRVILFLAIGRRTAPVAYPWRGAALGATALVGLAVMKPTDAGLTQDLTWAAAIILPLALAILWSAFQFRPAGKPSHAT